MLKEQPSQHTVALASMALSDPLQFFEKMTARPTVIPSYSAVFTNNRAYGAALAPFALSGFTDQFPGIFIANNGSHHYNQAQYLKRRGQTRDEQLQPRKTGGKGLEQTLEGDTIVVGSLEPDKTSKIMNVVVASYNSVGIDVAKQYIIVPSVRDWLDETTFRTDRVLMAHAWSPLFLEKLGMTQAEKDELYLTGMINAVIYSKHGFQSLMESSGLPTPPTTYFRPDSYYIEEFLNGMGEQFDGYDRFVVNGCFDTGGIGIEIVKREDLAANLASRSEITQIQSFLPDVTLSPCYLASVTDSGTSIITVSNQNLSRGVAHAGNIWSRRGIKDIETVAPGTKAMVRRALDVLHEVGVRGPINIDVIITANGSAYLREANVRNAGSQPLARLHDGYIDGSRIETVRLASKIIIPFSIISSPSFLSTLNHLCPSGTRILIYKYDRGGEKAGVAFCGIKGISKTDLELLERHTTDFLAHVQEQS